jgi:hypothetical protein
MIHEEMTSSSSKRHDDDNKKEVIGRIGFLVFFLRRD